ncbi:uncharacterized protein L201_006722 [Kwoniella dendrophila CBS 6074]|uniref:trans-L-3-hydroxyproline dehydratase n=1 Tax=Kwoniella dendrophila CBS 6074 TaxID=1295534 RepID=A0AAX4K4U4_9TREE
MTNSYQNISSYWLDTDEYHTAGEPFRIVPKLPEHCLTNGNTVMERRMNIVKQKDHPLDVLRRGLCHEPNGHPDMYGGFIVPPNDDKAHFGCLFFHKDGFSTACGHGTIALGAWAINKGLVDSPENGPVDVVIDVPSGRVIAQVHKKDNRIEKIDFLNVPSYQVSKDIKIKVESLGNKELTLDTSWGGALYAYLDINQIDKDLKVEPSKHDFYINLGREIKSILLERSTGEGYHQELELYGVAFYEELPSQDDEKTTTIVHRNVVIFADGELDRSPTGSSSAAITSLLYSKGKLQKDQKLINHSILNTTFECNIENVIIDEKTEDKNNGFPSCIVRVSGLAHLLGKHSYYIDSKDPVYPGFVFR